MMMMMMMMMMVRNARSCIMTTVVVLSVLELNIWLVCATLLSHASVSPENCSVDSDLAYVDCVNLSLSYVPSGLPVNTRTLNLSNNVISHLTAQDLRYLSSVEIIDLQNNILATISTDAFTSCSSLLSLYLDHNMLSTTGFMHSQQHVQELHISFNRITTVEAGSTVLPLTVLDLSSNCLQQFTPGILSSLQNLKVFNLSRNRIETVVLDDSSLLLSSSLRHFDVSANRLHTFKLCNECYSYSVKFLNLGSNNMSTVDSMWCQLLPNLVMFSIRRNPIRSIAQGTFKHCQSLETLDVSQLLIDKVQMGMFDGLRHVKTMKLDHNEHLASLEQKSFTQLVELAELDLRACSLMILEPATFLLTSSLKFVYLAQNPWLCDCDVDTVQELSKLSHHGVSGYNDAVCARPPSLRGKRVVNVSADRDECRAARPQKLKETVWAGIGAALLVDCNASGEQPLNITWLSKQNEKFVQVQHANKSVMIDDNRRQMEHEFDVMVLTNGSLYISPVSRASAGLYYCIASNEFGNGTMLLSVRLSSNAIRITTLHSIFIGLLSAAAFFLVAVIIGIARYLAYLCSTKERRKRKSIRAVLESIQDYKCAQFDRFSAYRTAKMDQLSAFKSAKIEQLSAFRDARVDRLRTYKQATVASILTHIERMREHYAAQTARIKDNCAQQAERLRERYSARRGRFKNYRSHQVDKMRENYAAQAARIREYGLIQMSRLREQYKTQQQYVLKLVELLDVGSCVSGVIEAECMKAESMIFDADIAFDFEAQPAHATEVVIATNAEDAGSECSHYVTASDSDLSLSSQDYSITCVADISVPAHSRAVKDDDCHDDVAGVLAVADDVLSHLMLDQPTDVLSNHGVTSVDDVVSHPSVETKIDSCTGGANCVEVADHVSDSRQTRQSDNE